jgi:hypothetical protein
LISTDVLFREPDAEEDRTNRAAREALRAKGTETAVAAFVLSVLWLFFLGSVAGLCLGAIARRRLAAERLDEEQAPASWARKLATAAIVIGGLGTIAAIALALLQFLHVLNITAACHPAVTGQSCSLIVRR